MQSMIALVIRRMGVVEWVETKVTLEADSRVIPTVSCSAGWRRDLQK